MCPLISNEFVAGFRCLERSSAVLSGLPLLSIVLRWLERSSAVFFKGTNSLDESALCAKRCVDISKDVFGCLFLEVDIAAARDGDETSLDLIRQTSVSFIQKGCEF